MSRDELGDALDLLAGDLTPVEPSPDTRQRLLEAVQGPLRFLPFAHDLAEHFDLPLPRMQALLRDIDRTEAWQPGIMPAIAYRHFEAGPRAAGLHAGFVRLARGGRTPEHRHVTRELTYVLRGRVIDSDGRSYGPGEACAKEPGSVHALTAGTEEECWAVTLLGQVAPP
jgi:putative transcriptional regulator